MEYITFAIAIISILITVLNFFNGRKDKAEKDLKENDREIANLKVFEVKIQNVQDDMKEMKQDIREIKQIFRTYKEDIRDIAKDVVHDIVQLEIQNHIEKYHSNKGN